jgi:hypothetical protein
MNKRNVQNLSSSHHNDGSLMSEISVTEPDSSGKVQHDIKTLNYLSSNISLIQLDQVTALLRPR